MAELIMMSSEGQTYVGPGNFVLDGGLNLTIGRGTFIGGTFGGLL